MISVVICTYNRSDYLSTTLRSFVAQNHLDAIDFELIVIDNNSNDDTRDVVESFISRTPYIVRYVFEGIQGLNTARNRGIKEAKGDVIAFTDDDVEIDENWLTNMSEFIGSHDFDALGGRVLPTYPDNTPEWVKANSDLLCGPVLKYDFGDETVEHNKGKKLDSFVGANMIFKREVFDKYGMFKVELGPPAQTMGDDTEMFIRLSNAGKKIYYAGNICVWHPVDSVRMNLQYVANWKTKAGRFYVHHQMDQKDNHSELKRIFGIPLYMIRRYILSGLGICVGVFNRRKLIIAWNKFFINKGMMEESRKLYRKQNA